MLLRTLIKSLLALTAAWLVTVVMLATPAVNLLLPRLVHDHLDHELQHGIILLDPFGMRLMAEQLSLHNRAGQQRLAVADVEINVDLWGSITQGQLRLEEMSLSQARLAPAVPSPDGPGASFEELSINGIQYDWRVPAISIDYIALNTPGVTADFIDGQTSFTTLWQDLLPTSAADSEAAPDKSQSAPLSLTVDIVEIDRGEVLLISDQMTPAAQSLQDLTLRARSIRWPEGGIPEFSITAELAPATAMSISGALYWAETAGDIAVEVTGFPLPSLQPTVDRYVRAVLDEGHLNLSTALQLRGLIPETARADLTINELAVHPGDADEPLTSLSSLKVGPVAIDMTQQQVNIAQIAITGARGLLHIDANGTTNYAAMRLPSTEQPEQAAPEDDGGSSPEWQLVIEDTTVTDSVLDFRDDNLPVQFSAHIEDLNGQLLGFDTNSDSAAQWQAEGRIDGYAPVTLSGSIAHYTAPDDGGFSFATRGVDLARLAPYSATYAGYPIERGVMAIDLDYTLQDGHLEGENHLLIERLALGDREPSDRQVVDLPLQIAVALLSDAAGMIEIDLPVNGAIDDPQFQIWQAVGAAAMNLLTNVITAPFNFLASLVGSDAPLDRVPFAAGDAELDVVAIGALDALAEALDQRPSIGIEVEAHVDLQKDARAMAESALHQALGEQGLEPASLRNRDASWQTAIMTMAAAEGIEASEPEATREALLKASFWPAQAALETLADDRAIAIKKHLIEQGGVDAQRIAIASRGSDTYGDSSAATLGITTR